MSNVPESDNGISLDVINSWKQSLVELAEHASNDTIRDCIRTYNPEKPTKQNVKALKTCLKDTIMETLMFLSKTSSVDTTIKNKDEAVNKLCLKIKNFFQDKCQICDETYTIKLDDQPLRNCGSCGQEVHRRCYVNILKRMNLLNEKQELTHLIFGIPGIYYLCPSCQEETINFPNPKTHDKVTTHVSPTNLQKPVSDITNRENQSIPSPRRTLPHLPITPNVVVTQRQESEIYLGRTEFMKNKFERALLNNTTLTSENTTNKSAQETESLQHIPESYQKHPESSQKNPDSSQHNQNYVPICNFYKKGKCKHGIKGKNCNYRHPKACVKLMRYGNKNPKGCIAGSKCTDFHPRMCSSSIKTGECFNTTCAFVHVKGTKRKPSSRKIPQIISLSRIFSRS